MKKHSSLCLDLGCIKNIAILIKQHAGEKQIKKKKITLICVLVSFHISIHSIQQLLFVEEYFLSGIMLNAEDMKMLKIQLFFLILHWPKCFFSFFRKNKRPIFHVHQELYWTYSPFYSITLCLFSGNFIIPFSQTYFIFLREKKLIPGAFYSIAGNWIFFQ